MSASDSDYSIDWLASDDEDHDSELEPDCTKAQQRQTTLPKSPSSGVIQGTQTCQSLSKRNGDKGVGNGQREHELSGKFSFQLQSFPTTAKMVAIVTWDKRHDQLQPVPREPCRQNEAGAEENSAAPWSRRHGRGSSHLNKWRKTGCSLARWDVPIFDLLAC